jgi:prefoldin subunit 5
MNNVDQRLERLVERHEALAQSLELLNSSTQDLRASVGAHDRYLSTLMQAVHQLLEVATNHERRLHHLESEG